MSLLFIRIKPARSRGAGRTNAEEEILGEFCVVGNYCAHFMRLTRNSLPLSSLLFQRGRQDGPGGHGAQGQEEALGEGGEVPDHRRGAGGRGAGNGASVRGSGSTSPASMASVLTEQPQMWRRRIKVSLVSLELLCTIYAMNLQLMGCIRSSSLSALNHASSTVPVCQICRRPP